MLPRPLEKFLQGADDLLRGRHALPAGDRAPHARTGLVNLFLTTVLFGMIYGFTMGTFGAFHGDRWLQLIYSALKVPMLLLVSFCLSLPSFFILNTILGVRADFGSVLRALVGTQAGLTVVLASLAPFTAFWSLCSRDYNTALTFNAAMFGIATLAGQWMLRRSYRPMIARNPRHLILLRIWLTLYAFVTIQMAWVLRPFVGSPGSAVTFFRREAWGNAYIELIHIVGHALGL